jgi:DNA-binding transcriptional regulator YbjK
VDLRAERILDAAIEVLGARGSRYLTNRAVDVAAGLPLGSTSNRFRTREALLVGVLERLLQREGARWTTVAAELRSPTISSFADAVGQQLTALAVEDRVLSLARRAVFIEAARQPALGEALRRAQDEITTWLAPILAGLGVPDPRRQARSVMALMDGLVSHQLVNPDPGFDPAAALDALVRGLVEVRRRGPSLRRAAR